MLNKEKAVSMKTVLPAPPAGGKAEIALYVINKVFMVHPLNETFHGQNDRL